MQEVQYGRPCLRWAQKKSMGVRSGKLADHGKRQQIIKLMYAIK